MFTQISRTEKRKSLYRLVRVIARRTGRSKAEILKAIAPKAWWNEEYGYIGCASVFEEYVYCLSVWGEACRWPVNSGKTIADTALIEYDL